MSSCTAQVTGVATGASCVSYDDCSTTCCTKTYTGCSGTPDGHCWEILDVDLCWADSCCRWIFPGPPVGCAAYDCNTLGSESLCVQCGCTGSGTCIHKDCDALTDNNPDVCEGCFTCPGNWNVDDIRSPVVGIRWNIVVTGVLNMQAGGRVTIKSSRCIEAGDVNAAGGGEVHIYQGEVWVT